jgi:hypothetical protein
MAGATKREMATARNFIMDIYVEGCIEEAVD